MIKTVYVYNHTYTNTVYNMKESVKNEIENTFALLLN